ncbi:MAG: hypothetical protein PUG48_11340 [Clostridia bacterium]|nr:hypothetical protein [Clostridia bacterium]
MNDKEVMVEKSEISGIARDVDAILCIVQEVIEDFFTLDTNKNQMEILWEYERARAKTEAINVLALDAKNDLEQLDINGYD